MNIQRLEELEQIAFNNGDTLRAEIISELIDTKQALEDLVFKGQKLNDSLKNEQADAPEWLEAGAFVYWAHCVDLENFRDALSASESLVDD
jgi:hypothetical protein